MDDLGRDREDRCARQQEAPDVAVADDELFELARQVGVLYWQREPLNITAVKRRHPEIVAAAFARSPFVGWKGLLDRAGIPYRKIRVELQGTVLCAICGARFQGLQVHLHRIHGVSAKTYLAEFPGSEISSEQLRARFFVRTAKSRLIMPHWERLWSREYVLDRIAELHRRGVPLNVQSFFERGHEPSLYAAGTEFFPTWKDALAATGIDPDEVRQEVPKGYWTAARVLTLLRDRLQANQSVSAKALRTEGSLYVMARRFFGSYEEALRQAGAPPAMILTLSLRPAA